ncbi:MULTISPECIES: glycosyltransferase family 2 protein [Antarcticibacterium]|nr:MULTISPECIES: glycosyltransferase family A protein [Antarcticibacterium]
MSEVDLCSGFWEMAEKYPNEIIAWCEEDFENDIKSIAWKDVFHHDLIMASYAIKSAYIPDTIGYIDQLPFVNFNREVPYPTWRMSTDIGGIKGRVLLEFQKFFAHIKDFGLLLTSIAKLGQQNGLFCYSSPHLIKDKEIALLEPIFNTASKKELFAFVYAHYKMIRLWLLFLCFMRYEKSFPLQAFLYVLFQRKYFKKNVDLSGISMNSRKLGLNHDNIDVIIPTLGRKSYLLQVLEDFKKQTQVPQKVIVVEQNPELDSQTELPELKTKTWPFEIVHLFTHQTGACNARNLALKEVTADWVFFADDDIRLSSELLKQSILELNRLETDCLNINCKQKDEERVFHKIKQWGSFGAGTCIVNKSFCTKLNFDDVFEYGFGEDQDYGMQLRNIGCDIIYHPHLEILHLKAPRGGFRTVVATPWEKDKPKPSPTLMVLAKKYYSLPQIRGYKTELFLRYYWKQEIINPIKYFKMMSQRWKISEEWAEKLMADKESKSLKTELSNEF